jgi:hypothetical protein
MQCVTLSEKISGLELSKKLVDVVENSNEIFDTAIFLKELLKKPLDLEKKGEKICIMVFFYIL